jgi:hypothetical protein
MDIHDYRISRKFYKHLSYFDRLAGQIRLNLTVFRFSKTRRVL